MVRDGFSAEMDWLLHSHHMKAQYDEPVGMDWHVGELVRVVLVKLFEDL